jgi:hypothetical protein
MKKAIKDLTYDHAQPNSWFQKYLDAEGKWTGQTPCTCEQCRARRATK